MTDTDAPAPKPFVPVRFAVLAVSDSRTLDDDRSGATLVERIEGAGHIMADRAIVTDDEGKIRKVVKRWLKDADVERLGRAHDRCAVVLREAHDGLERLRAKLHAGPVQVFSSPFSR